MNVTDELEKARRLRSWVSASGTFARATVNPAWQLKPDAVGRFPLAVVERDFAALMRSADLGDYQVNALLPWSRTGFLRYEYRQVLHVPLDVAKEMRGKVDWGSVGEPEWNGQTYEELDLVAYAWRATSTYLNVCTFVERATDDIEAMSHRWHYADSLHEPCDDVEDEFVRLMITPLARTFVVAKLPIVQAARPQATRQYARRHPDVIETSRIVRLRRRQLEQSALTDAEAVEWSHRWVVRGHRRNQWYPGEQRHREIWIEPYVKGPDDKPLVEKEIAFSLDRTA